MPMKIYFDFRDWWIGYYRGDFSHYICPLPTLVIRWNRQVSKAEPPTEIMGIPIEYSDVVPEGKIFLQPRSEAPAIKLSIELEKATNEILAAKYQRLFVNPRAVELVNELKNYKWNG